MAQPVKPSENIAERIAVLEKELKALKEEATHSLPTSLPPKSLTKKSDKKAKSLPEESQELQNFGRELKEGIRAQEEYPKETSESGSLYLKARSYISLQRLDLAKKILEDIIEKHSTSPEAILARFWRGEILSHGRQYSQAAVLYGEAYGSLKDLQKKKGYTPKLLHGEEERLPEILAKLAFTFKMIGKKREACVTLKQLKKEYSELPSSLVEYVNQLNNELQCK